jgi:hypothetical protein
MPARQHKRLLYRPLLTETLPYEVPIIFSNSQLYASLCEELADADLLAAMSKARPVTGKWSTPYEYSIAKGAASIRNLAVIHPLHQIKIARFYADYERSILYSCARSPFSLRRPSAISGLYIREAVVGADAETASDDSAVDADQEEAAPEGVSLLAEDSAPKIGSYFSYKYNNIGRFIDSPEFVRLEKRFSTLRNIDISRCFHNIYTHSVAWAVKGKAFAKKHAQKHTFENNFDRLMMDANNNETNGIVIGPELSRIFAEVIFQEIDSSLLRDMQDKGLREEWDYSVRRYVDDYYIFTNNAETCDFVEAKLRNHLAFFKMYPNEEKSRTSSRPYISNISVARKEIKEEFRRIGALIAQITPGSDAVELSRDARQIARDVGELRIIIARNDVEMSAVSGWLLGFVKTHLDRLGRRMEGCAPGAAPDGFADVVVSLLRLAFYICALDFRVRPTYSMAEILLQVQPFLLLMDENCRDQVEHVISEELVGLVRRNAGGQGLVEEPQDAVELYNTLISGAHLLGEDFVRIGAVRETLLRLCTSSNLTYFRFITAKFCMRKDRARFAPELEEINRVVEALLTAEPQAVYVIAERYLLFADFLSSPDVDEKRKRAVFKAVTGTTVTKKTMALVGPRMRFADWDGRGFRSLLERRELRPAYE